MFIAIQIWNTFGREHFATWKKRLLDTSNNWKEYLDKSEVDAVALSIVTLADKPLYQDLWWQLVDAHGRATGAMRYAELWYAYQKLVDYIQDKRLTPNRDVLHRYLNQTPNFNGKIFLDRLYFVLKKASTQLDNEKVQQNILNQLDKIDWRHNGFYYANRYEAYPYWHKQLQISDFHPAAESPIASYAVEWAADAEIKQPITHALRFASQRMRLCIGDFTALELKLRESTLSEMQQPKYLSRMLLGYLSVGVDTVEQLTVPSLNSALIHLDKGDHTFLSWFNNLLNLNSDLQPQLQMRFADIALFAEMIAEVGLAQEIYQLSTESALEFINACGRALQCYQYHCLGDRKSLQQRERFRQLLEYVKTKNDFTSPLVMDYPWLITEYNPEYNDPVETAMQCENVDQPELLHFRDQLRTIDFAKSTMLPECQQLVLACQSITSAKERRGCVSKLVQQGCIVTRQDAPFRSLNDDERKFAITYFDRYLKANFKSQNLPLCEKLLDYLAIKSSEDPTQQINKLLTVLARLDNKSYYNELGQVVGLLINKAKANGTSHYSVWQLSIWLETLIDDKVFAHQHYPTNLLNELLAPALAQPNDSSLLNQNLNLLSNRVD